MTHVNHCDTTPGFTGDPAATLASSLAENGSETSIQVDDNSDFPSSRIIIIGSEEIFYTGVSGGNTFTGCIRGYGTSKPAHSPGEAVTLKKDTCNDFDNYADAWLDCAGHSDSAPELCPDAFQGDFHVDNSACYNDVSHVNSYSHTPHYNVYSHTAHYNVYYHTPFYNRIHVNTYYHTPFANGSHSHSCNGFNDAIGYSHGDTNCSAGHCDWSDSSPWPGGLKHVDSGTFGNTPHTNSYSHTPFSQTSFSDTYYHTPFSQTSFSDTYYHTPFYNVYSHTPHYNVYSHTPFVDFCNHTDHNAG